MFTLYELFRHSHLEWAIYAAILSYGIGKILSSQRTRRFYLLYSLGNFLSMALLLPLVNLSPYRPVFETQGSSIWPFFLLFTVNNCAWLFAAYREKWTLGMSYAMYYLSFITLLKTALVPFFKLEASIPRGTYALLDILHIVLLSLTLTFAIRFFQNCPITPSPKKLPCIYGSIFIIPWAIVVVFTLFVTGVPIFWQNQQPILAGTLALLLPIVY
ncbi:MAG: hypothetical protein IIZ39_11720, partial [Blautia sp.]|nr:hypothetical protein [Blautia sp.]